MSRKSHKQEGFTLIEILVVVALIAILAAVTIVAINPGKNFADTRNATRSADVAQVLNAVTQYTSEEGNSITDFAAAIDRSTLQEETMLTQGILFVSHQEVVSRSMRLAQRTELRSA